MTKLHVQVRLQRTTDLPQDVIIQTFNFSTTSPTEAVLDEISTRINNFYKAIPAGEAGAIIARMAPIVKSAGSELRIYDATTLPMGPPIRVEPFVLLGLPSSSLSMPAEVAICLSYKAAVSAGVPARRSRGRIYFGPLTATNGATNTNGDVRPQGGLQTQLAAAGLALANSNGAADWVVQSDFVGIIQKVVEVYVDDAFDTQRRRGAKPTSRVTRTVSQV
jgi:hypothetical protein